ncbi:MAG: hypothetical protein M0042_15285 [Nitrospiraceae bacterium]|nr:hypothetical protein [Nitrospiraceae bacterium]
MGTARDAKKNYCDEVLNELAYMIQNINDLKEEGSVIYGKDSAVYKAHDKHLTELAEYLDWKLQILTTACPFDWKGLGEDVQSVVSVDDTGRAEEFAGGYIGG